MAFDFLIVGAGFAGAVCAQQLSERGHTVLLIDKRPHIGGNAHDRLDQHGVRIHPYGPHIFHTNSKKIFDYLSRFTSWRFYEHRVLAQVGEGRYPIPINRTTVNRLYGLNLSEEEVAEFFAQVREPRTRASTSEDIVLSSVGRDLCEKFFRGYTRKQWGLDLSQLSAGVAARIPTRTNDDDRYFTDAFQFMPADGYSAMFDCMLDDPNIRVEVETPLRSLLGKVQWRHMIYTGPIDEFYDFKFGRLPYRSLVFEHKHLPATEWYQETGTVNFPNDHEFTRITEFKYITGQVHSGTSIVREYPTSEGEPYYPIPRPENETIYGLYRELSKAEGGTSFVGRLAQYRYYNMDQVVGAALVCVERIVGHQ